MEGRPTGLMILGLSLLLFGGIMYANPTMLSQTVQGDVGISISNTVTVGNEEDYSFTVSYGNWVAGQDIGMKWRVDLIKDFNNPLETNTKIGSGTLTFSEGKIMSKTITGTWTAPTEESPYKDGWAFHVEVENDYLASVVDLYAQATGSSFFTIEKPDDPAPTAEFSYSPSGPVVGETVSFDAYESSANPKSDSIKRYEWAFGDGSTDTGKAPNHQYTNSGDYTVNLTVYDEADQTGVTTENVSVSSDGEDGDDDAPVASFTYDPHSPKGGVDEVTFDASGSKPGQDVDAITEYEWSIGGKTKYGKTASHTFQTTGEIQVTLKVTNSAGLIDSYSQQVDVKSPGEPSAQFNISKTEPEVGETVTFDASKSEPIAQDVTIDSYEWNFGDGTTRKGETVSHAYDGVGDFPVTLTVSTNMGTSDDQTKTVSVSGEGKKELSTWIPMIVIGIGAISLLGGVFDWRG